MLSTSWNSFTLGTCPLYFKMHCRIWNKVFLTTQQYVPCILCLAPLLKANLLPNGASLQCNSGCKGGREAGSHLKHSPYGPLCTVTCKMGCVQLNMVRMLMSSRPLFWEKIPFLWWKIEIRSYSFGKFKFSSFFVRLIIISFCALLCMELLTKVWMDNTTNQNNNRLKDAYFNPSRNSSFGQNLANISAIFFTIVIPTMSCLPFSFRWNFVVLLSFLWNQENISAIQLDSSFCTKTSGL